MNPCRNPVPVQVELSGNLSVARPITISLRHELIYYPTAYRADALGNLRLGAERPDRGHAEGDRGRPAARGGAHDPVWDPAGAGEPNRAAALGRRPRLHGRPRNGLRRRPWRPCDLDPRVRGDPRSAAGRVGGPRGGGMAPPREGWNRCGKTHGEGQAQEPEDVRGACADEPPDGRGPRRP